MDWQEVFSLLIFVLLAVFSKKRKLAEEDAEPSEEDPSVPEIDTVRRRIEALKQQRNKVHQKELPPLEAPSKEERPVFSAYKHLPKEEVIETVQVPESVPMAPLEDDGPKHIQKSIDLPRKRSRLRDWVVGQVILGDPAYRRYGSFIHR